MGRKSNPLVADYFSRGPKLPDSSNRYEHTCRNCHERFPKGRSDHLLNHLRKQCPALSNEERNHILHRLSKLETDSGRQISERSERPETLRKTNVVPVPSQSPFDGLTVLAEASRRVGATERRKNDARSDGRIRNAVMVDPAIDTEIHAFNEPGPQPFPSPNLPSMSLPPFDVIPDTRETTDLSSIASYANDMVTQSMLPMESEASLQRILEVQPEQPLFNAEDETDLTGLADPVHRASQFPRPIAPAGPESSNAAISTAQSLQLKKTRAKFTPARRKEVSDMRKTRAYMLSYHKRTYLDVALFARQDRQRASILFMWLDPEDNARRNQFNPQQMPFPIRSNHEFSPSTFVLGGELNDVDEKLVDYLKMIKPHFLQEEPHAMMRWTFDKALAEVVAANDSLLNHVTELWTATGLLVRTIDLSLKWQMTWQIPSEAVKSVSWSFDRTSRSDQDRIVIYQLLSSLEKRADQLSGAVTNELEHLLLRRKNQRPLTTIATSIILLNCVERMSWLYQAWAAGEHSSEQWPLSQSEVDYVKQGERFCDIVIMLINMQNLVPKLSVSNEHGLLVARNGLYEQVDEWINGLGMTHAFIHDRQAARIDFEDCGSLDFTLISKMFHLDNSK
ncbi:MAG: hypothetical protein Q9227_000818 [Pyrenula ochraceoflavens]